MKKNVFIGADIGTGSCKVVAFDQGGAMLALQSLEYPTIFPQSGWAEQDPKVVLNSLVKCLKLVVDEVKSLNYQIGAIGLSSVFHSVLAVDKNNEPLTNCLIWADSRSIGLVEEIKQATPPHAWYSRTGCQLHPMYPPGKILWWKLNMPETFDKTAKFLSIKEYVVAEFFGAYLVDTSLASASGLFNFNTLTWDTEILDYLGISSSHLSEPVSPQTVLRSLKPHWAAATGIDPSIPWVIGAGDGVLSSVGTGSVIPGVMTAMIGTSGALRVLSPIPRVDPKGRTWCYHLTGDMWVLGGAINSGGIVYRWFRDNFAGEFKQGGEPLSYEILNKMVDAVPLGAAGMMFLPHLSGERSPYWNANARGVLFGVGLEHGKPHLARAIIEGITCAMYSVFIALEELTGQSQEIRATGGFARSRTWLQIMSDVFGREVSVPQVVEGSAFGAAILAMVALGYLPSVQSAREMVTIGEAFQPKLANNEKYRKLFALYERIYWKLQEEFAIMAELRKELAGGGTR
ncbi:MAG: gluconokinase [Bacillota bacterium]